MEFLVLVENTDKESRNDSSKAGASAVIAASENANHPKYSGIEKIAALPKTDFRIFGKPTSRPYRRMGVVLTNDILNTDIEQVIEKAKAAAQLITVKP